MELLWVAWEYSVSGFTFETGASGLSRVRLLCRAFRDEVAPRFEPPRRMRPRREKACPGTRAPPDRPALGGGAPLATARGTPLPAHPALRTPLASPGATPLTVMKHD